MSCAGRRRHSWYIPGVPSDQTSTDGRFAGRVETSPSSCGKRVENEVIGTIFGPGTGGHYDEIVEQTLEGRDQVWKEALLDKIVEPRRLLDLACGTGILIGMMRERFPDCRIVGVDMTEEYLAVARSRAEARGDDRIELIHSRAEEAQLDGQFDHIVTAYLPKYADLSILVPRLVRHLEPGGSIIMQDFVWPRDRFVAEFLEHRFERLIAWARENLPEAVGMFEALPPVIRESNWMVELRDALAACGIEEIDERYFDLEQAAMVWGRRPSTG